MLLTQWLTKFSRGLNLLAGLLSVVLVILTLEQVIARYFFSESSIAMQELQWHIFATMFLIAAAYGIQQDDHVRVDIFYGKMSARQKLWTDTAGYLFFLLPSMLLLAWYGIEYAQQARSYSGAVADGSWFYWLLQGEGSPNPGGLPARWILKAGIPLFAILNLMQGLVALVQRWQHNGQSHD